MFSWKELIWLTCLCLPANLLSQQFSLPLWPEGIPCENELEMEIVERYHGNGRMLSKVHEPTIEVYLPATALSTGTGVVICPGGGYTILAWDKEGVKIAEWFNSLGVAAFVLKYRLPHWESESCRDKVALPDAQRAIRIVRQHAREWQLASNRIGIMGFSAGGHLASTASTHFDDGNPDSPLNIEHFSCRPDFSILMYPVISMDTTIYHRGSRTNLIGKNPSREEEQYFSNEKQVSPQTPPTLLIHADNDRAVIPENSIQYYLALRKNKVPAAMHIFEKGGHGFGLAEGRGAVSGWPSICRDWMTERGLLNTHLQALIIDGQNNHSNWPETTPIIESHLRATGLFSVDIARTPPKGEDMSSFDPDFSKYDVVISNYNGDDWPQQTQQNFMRFLRNGGGLVSVHAANNAFPEWKAFNEMIGLGGWGNRNERHGPYIYLNDKGELVRDNTPGPGGHHGPRHSFLVHTRAPEHPVMQGFPEAWLHVEDELYDLLRGPAKNMQILATAYSDPEKKGTGRHEPMVMTINYGLGRVFHTTLGHLNESMLCQGFAVLLQRGAEWAATGEVTQQFPDEFPDEQESKMVNEGQ